ncbi:hypothetical protein V495_07189 [Pseudogymnoascus sp. VKM F-4514 (FW-929)]|nr:hypothetical protein V495_07189 [Pseudogymnoascus sp. VKM F-4514 (FW-929)]KFY52060.1 hypothetical protein V497_08671 [Pseudogymnoascus sp. VKM F-4516 (FW-969)]
MPQPLPILQVRQQEILRLRLNLEEERAPLVRQLEEELLYEIADLKGSDGGEIGGDAENIDGGGVLGALGARVKLAEHDTGAIISSCVVEDAWAVEPSIITSERGMELLLHQGRDLRIQLRHLDERAGIDVDVVRLISPQPHILEPDSLDAFPLQHGFNLARVLVKPCLRQLVDTLPGVLGYEAIALFGGVEGGPVAGFDERGDDGGELVGAKDEVETMVEAGVAAHPSQGDVADEDERVGIFGQDVEDVVDGPFVVGTIA